MTTPEPFSEEAYHEENLKIMNVIRQFSQIEILEQCYQFLRKPVQGGAAGHGQTIVGSISNDQMGLSV